MSWQALTALSTAFTGLVILPTVIDVRMFEHIARDAQRFMGSKRTRERAATTD